MLSLGEYPQVGLREARLKAQELAAKMDASGGVSPQPPEQLLFTEIVRKALNEAMASWRPSYARTQEVRFERYIAPLFNGKDMGK